MECGRRSGRRASVANTGKSTGKRGRPENLKPRWQKGQSGNPSGRPRTKPITDEIKRQLEDACRFDSDGRTNLQAGVRKLMDQFVGGVPHAQKLVFEYVDGPPTQTFDLRGKINELAERWGVDADELYSRTLRLIEGGKAN